MESEEMPERANENALQRGTDFGSATHNPMDFIHVG